MSSELTDFDYKKLIDLVDFKIFDYKERISKSNDKQDIELFNKFILYYKDLLSKLENKCESPIYRLE